MIAKTEKPVFCYGHALRVVPSMDGDPSGGKLASAEWGRRRP
jgi:hypothetical protein